MLSTADFFQLIRKSGLQRTNRFQVMIKIPEAVIAFLDDDSLKFDSRLPGTVGTRLQAFGNNPERLLSLTATQVIIPGYNVATTDMKVGLTRRVATDVQHGELTIVFRCTGDMIEKKVFDAWRKVVQRPDRSLGFYDTYISGVQIMAMDAAENIAYETSVTEAYPLTVTELTFNREEMDAIATFSVTFTYRKLYNLNEDYGEKRKIMPVAYPGKYEPGTPAVWIDAEGLPRATNTAVEYPPLALPAPPPNATRPLYLMDVYTSIERVKVRIEDGTLDPNLGSNMLRGMANDIGQQFAPSPDVDNLINYVDDMIYDIGVRR